MSEFEADVDEPVAKLSAAGVLHGSSAAATGSIAAGNAVVFSISLIISPISRRLQKIIGKHST